MTYTLSQTGLWVNRAHQAWGTSRQWGVGSSFEQDLTAMTADRNTWQTRANTAYDSGTWASGTHWHDRWTATDAALTAMTNDRNYWRDTVAHGDPNVWDNRYNAGYAAGDAAGYARGLAAIAGSGQTPNMYDAWSANVNLPVQSYANLSFNPNNQSSNWGSGVTLVCPRTGHYHISFTLDTPSVASNRQVVFQFLRNGGALVDTGTVEVGDFGNKGHVYMVVIGVWSAGDQMVIRGQSWQAQTIGIGAGHVVCTFVPTDSFPN